MLISTSASFAVQIIDERVQQYSRDLKFIQNEIFEQFGATTISIGGGTARALIQSVLQNKPFVFRDFDLVISVNQQVKAETAFALEAALEKKGLGQFPKSEYSNQKICDAKLCFNDF